MEDHARPEGRLSDAPGHYWLLVGAAGDLRDDDAAVYESDEHYLVATWPQSAGERVESRIVTDRGVRYATQPRPYDPRGDHPTSRVRFDPGPVMPGPVSDA